MSWYCSRLQYRCVELRSRVYDVIPHSRWCHRTNLSGYVTFHTEEECKVCFPSSRWHSRISSLKRNDSNRSGSRIFCHDEKEILICFGGNRTQIARLVGGRSPSVQCTLFLTKKQILIFLFLLNLTISINLTILTDLQFYKKI